MGALQNEPKKAELELTAVLNALSDKTRLHIVQSLTGTRLITKQIQEFAQDGVETHSVKLS